MGGDYGSKGEVFSGITIKDTWIKPKRGRSNGEVVMAGMGEGGKCRQL